MSSLNLGSHTIECDGSVVTCGEDSLAVADVVVDERGRMNLFFPKSEVSVCLHAGEWKALLGLPEEIAEMTTLAEETTAPEVEVVAAPVAKKGRRKS